jgi:hypothetical protein
VRHAGNRLSLVREGILMVRLVVGGWWLVVERRSAAAVLLALSLIGCGPTEPLNVVAVQTGKSLNTDHSVGSHTGTFRPKDTMYVSVLSVGRGAGTITVKWTFGGRVVHEVAKKVSYNDQAATDFRFQAADDFPLGEYTIDVIVDGKTFETRRVKVE